MCAAPAGSLTPVAVYRREIGASLERIWENVLDWEHLPWLHRDSFLGVHLLEAGRDGWRAEVHLPPAAAPRAAEIAVRLERGALRYRTTTLTGFGAGSDIVTELEPVDVHATAITVAFHVPGIDAAHRDAVGTAYTRLYERLWSEDESMMVRRQAILDGPRNRQSVAPLELGTHEDVRARLPLVVRVGDDEVRVVEIAGELVAHPTVCPHRGGPLADTAVEGSCISCPWHGYRFDLHTGASADGRSYRLGRSARVTIDPRTGGVTLTP